MAAFLNCVILSVNFRGDKQLAIVQIVYFGLFSTPYLISFVFVFFLIVILILLVDCPIQERWYHNT